MILAYNDKDIPLRRLRAERLHVVECQRSRRVRSTCTRSSCMHNRRTKIHGFVEFGFGTIREGAPRWRSHRQICVRGPHRRLGCDIPLAGRLGWALFDCSIRWTRFAKAIDPRSPAAVSGDKKVQAVMTMFRAYISPAFTRHGRRNRMLRAWSAVTGRGCGDDKSTARTAQAVNASPSLMNMYFASPCSKTSSVSAC